MPKVNIDDFDEFDDELFAREQKIVKKNLSNSEKKLDKKNKPKRGKVFVEDKTNDITD